MDGDVRPPNINLWDIGPDEVDGVYVNTGAANCGTGSGRRLDPFCDIASGLAVATEGQVVFVATGNYSENVDITREVRLFGGYDAAWHRDIMANTTAIYSDRDIGLSLYYGVKATIQGFTIRGATITGSTTRGVSCAGGNQLLLADNEISAGSGSDPRGVMADGEVVLLRNRVDGGQSSSSPSSAVFVNSNGHVVAVNNVLDAGDSSGNSYGVFAWGAATLINNDIHGGSGTGRLPVFITGGSERPVVLVNNILDARGGSYAIQAHTMFPGQVTLMHNDLWDATLCAANVGTCMANESAVNLCDVSQPNLCAESDGNFINDPEVTADYHLSDGSPCTDTGIEPGQWYDGDLVYRDVDRESRPMGNGWDVGIDEHP